MQKKFEINRTKNKGSCQSGRKVVTHNSYSDLPLMNWCKNESNYSDDYGRVKVSINQNMNYYPIAR